MTTDVRPLFPGSYSEVYTYGKAIQILKERLNDRYAIYVKHLDRPTKCTFNGACSQDAHHDPHQQRSFL